MGHIVARRYLTDGGCRVIQTKNAFRLAAFPGRGFQPQSAGGSLRHVRILPMDATECRCKQFVLGTNDRGVNTSWRLLEGSHCVCCSWQTVQIGRCCASTARAVCRSWAIKTYTTRMSRQFSPRLKRETSASSVQGIFTLAWP